MNYLTSEQNNPVDNLIEIYNSDYCITLDELPDLKKYPINGDNTTVTTAKTTAVTTTKTTTAKTTAVTTTKTTTAKTTAATTTNAATSTTVVSSVKVTMKGDANCDEQVNLGDVVLIMQSIANMPKYGLDGSDPSHITHQGLANADVIGNDGVTNLDALEIQKYRLDLVKW